ncbi:hypothetical protein C8A05DRAFT_18261 [Staphylotrichum tortipilum]|uniref:Uncharacterized protein n=1 Tax=Staphylotrichum tortipilum TaxID=2831512 RepID=A0AAN6MFP9_9PEZI|nr:hypothetical protein C8A05DRAFT_18261 [Staphylotrichum longicolle]
MPSPTIFLLDFFPCAGFRWCRGQGSPRVLRSESRDAVVFWALVDLVGGGGVRIRKQDVQPAVVGALATTAKVATDGNHGNRPGEGVIDFLLRAAKFSEFASSIPGDIWVELVYQIANARNEYKRRTGEAQQLGEASQLTALSFAIDDLIDAVRNSWDWATLVLYVYPYLMGEAVDYEIDEDEDEDKDNDEEEMEVAGDNMVAPTEGSADSEMAVEEDALAAAGENVVGELPSRMARLQIIDEDGDAEMVDLM